MVIGKKCASDGVHCPVAHTLHPYGSVWVTPLESVDYGQFIRIYLVVSGVNVHRDEATFLLWVDQVAYLLLVDRVSARCDVS